MPTLTASPDTFMKLLRRIPDLGEEAIKRTWKGVRSSKKFTQQQKKKLVRILKFRKLASVLQKKLHTVTRNMSDAGHRKTRGSRRKTRSRHV